MDNQVKTKPDYSEYNKVHLPRADNMVCFIKNLNHAMQKVEIPGAYDAIMHQLKCIGYSEDLISAICEAASYYKTHHKERIRAEQNPIDRAVSGDILYPVIWAQKLPSDDRESVSVYSVAKTSEKAKTDMMEFVGKAKASFKEAVKGAAEPNAMLCFEASSSEGNYEIHLDGNEDNAYCRIWVGKAVFL